MIIKKCHQFDFNGKIIRVSVGNVLSKWAYLRLPWPSIFWIRNSWWSPFSIFIFIPVMRLLGVIQIIKIRLKKKVMPRELMTTIHNQIACDEVVILVNRTNLFCLWIGYFSWNSIISLSMSCTSKNLDQEEKKKHTHADKIL